MDKQHSIFDLASEVHAVHTELSGVAWHIFIDGASRGNPGPAGVGVFIQKNKKVHEKYGCFIGEKTNNQAEYLALLLALFCLKKEYKKGDIVQITSDSQLLINQMNGIYKVRHTSIRSMFDAAVAESHDMMITFEHVLREYNREADALANAGIDKKKSLPLKFLDMLQRYEIYI